MAQRASEDQNSLEFTFLGILKIEARGVKGIGAALAALVLVLAGKWMGLI